MPSQSLNKRYRISYLISNLLFLFGIAGIVGFVLNLHNDLIIPVFIAIMGYGMKRTIAVATKKGKENNYA